MKTKLLKKVRNRFKIERVDFVSSTWSYGLKCKESLGLPFYMFTDNYDIYLIEQTSFKKYEDAFDHLIKEVIRAYKGTKKKGRSKMVKVWYNN